MGLAIVILLAAILCAMLFGPFPVIVFFGVVVGIGAAYAILILLAEGVGKTLAAVKARLPFRRRSDGHEPIFVDPTFVGYLLLVLVGFTIYAWLRR